MLALEVLALPLLFLDIMKQLIAFLLFVCACAATMAVPPVALAAEPAAKGTPGSAGTTSIRVYGAFELGGTGEWGLDVSQQLTPRLALDVIAGEFSLNDDSGVQAHLHARWISGDRHRATIGGGPALLETEHMGTVAMLDVEMGYEFRDFRGLSFLFALGPSLVLNDSRPAGCADRGLFGCFWSREFFRAGERISRIRVAIGASF